MQGDLNCDNDIEVSILSSGSATEVAMEMDLVHRFQHPKAVDWELIE